MAHTFTCLLFHLVFSTKDRRPLLTGDVRDRVHCYLGGIVRELGGRAIIVGGIADHVHLLVETPSKLATSDLLRVLKANSSGWIHTTFPAMRAFAWQTGYGAFSVSPSKTRKVESYIAHQEAHHGRRDFKGEFEALLKRHGLRWDDPYLWE